MIPFVINTRDDAAEKIQQDVCVVYGVLIDDAGEGTSGDCVVLITRTV